MLKYVYLVKVTMKNEPLKSCLWEVIYMWKMWHIQISKSTFFLNADLSTKVSKDSYIFLAPESKKPQMHKAIFWAWQRQVLSLFHSIPVCLQVTWESQYTLPDQFLTFCEHS